MLLSTIARCTCVQNRHCCHRLVNSFRHVFVSDCVITMLSIDMQSTAAFHEEAVVQRQNSVKWRMNWLAVCEDGSDILGKQADSLTAFLDGTKGHTLATFKDSQVLLCG